MNSSGKKVFCVVLAGGVGSRLGMDVPKQYIMVNKYPIIKYSYDTILNNSKIDGVVIVLNEMWKDFVCENLDINNKKFLGFAKSGSSRQESILNGMKQINDMVISDNDIVIIHDAARPNITDEIIDRCVEFDDCDGVMPALESYNTMYYSEDGLTITSLLKRENVFSGQAPESFLFKKYYNCFCNMKSSQLAEIKGSSEIAHKLGLKIKIVAGDEHNYKITTLSDLKRFQKEKESVDEGI